MRWHGTYADWGRWKDRVAGTDEPLDDSGFEHAEMFVVEALDVVQQVVEAAIEPIIDIAASMRGLRFGAWSEWRTGAAGHRPDDHR